MLWDGWIHTHTHRGRPPPSPPPLGQVALSAAEWGWPHTCPFVHHVPGCCPGVQSSCDSCPRTGGGRTRGQGCMWGGLAWALVLGNKGLA